MPSCLHDIPLLLVMKLLLRGIHLSVSFWNLLFSLVFRERRRRGCDNRAQEVRHHLFQDHDRPGGSARTLHPRRSLWQPAEGWTGRSPPHTFLCVEKTKSNGKVKLEPKLCYFLLLLNYISKRNIILKIQLSPLIFQYLSCDTLQNTSSDWDHV